MDFIQLMIMENQGFRTFSFYPEETEWRLFLICIILTIFNFPLKAQEDSKPSIMGMVVGVGYGKLKNNDATDKEFVFKPSYTKLAGFTLEIPIPKLEKRATLYNEISFSQFEANASVHLPDSSQGFPARDYYDVTQKFAPNLLSITNMFRYCFTNNTFKYYVSAGIYNSFVISPVNRKITIHTQNGTANTTVEESVPDYATHGLMLIIGTGFYYKYAGIEIRYDPGRNYTKQVDYSVYNPTIYAVLNVRFNP